MGQYEITHSEKENMFLIGLPDEEKAYVSYRYTEPGTVDFYRTFVPAEYRSKGLAADLVEYALDWAEQENLAIEASCWYAAKKLALRAGH